MIVLQITGVSVVLLPIGLDLEHQCIRYQITIDA